MIQINLLPWREQARKDQQKRFAIIVAIAAGLGLIFAGIFHIQYAAKINFQLKRNGILQTALDESSSSLMIMNKQKTELDEVDSQLHFIFDLRESSYRAVRLLNELAVANPESVTLFKLVRNGDDITVFGKAKSNLQITMFMDNLEKAKIFTQPDLTEITGKEGEVGDERKFELKMQQLR